MQFMAMCFLYFIFTFFSFGLEGITYQYLEVVCLLLVKVKKIITINSMLNICMGEIDFVIL